GVVMVPGVSGIVGRAAPTGGMTMGPGIEPAAALAANERTSTTLSSGSAINGLWMKRPFVTADFLPVRAQDDNALRQRQVPAGLFCAHERDHPLFPPIAVDAPGATAANAY